RPLAGHWATAAPAGSKVYVWPPRVRLVPPREHFCCGSRIVERDVRSRVAIAEAGAYLAEPPPITLASCQPHGAYVGQLRRVHAGTLELGFEKADVEA